MVSTGDALPPTRTVVGTLQVAHAEPSVRLCVTVAGTTQLPLLPEVLLPAAVPAAEPVPVVEVLPVEEGAPLVVPLTLPVVLVVAAPLEVAPLSEPLPVVAALLPVLPPQAAARANTVVANSRRFMVFHLSRWSGALAANSHAFVPAPQRDGQPLRRGACRVEKHLLDRTAAPAQARRRACADFSPF
jgi:hypothetical protein